MTPSSSAPIQTIAEQRESARQLAAALDLIESDTELLRLGAAVDEDARQTERALQAQARANADVRRRKAAQDANVAALNAYITGLAASGVPLPAIAQVSSLPLSTIKKAVSAQRRNGSAPAPVTETETL